jgi:hypothetical protein
MSPNINNKTNSEGIYGTALESVAQIVAGEFKLVKYAPSLILSPKQFKWFHAK